MTINWYGEGCFRIVSGEADILVDPFEAKIGLTPPRFHPTFVIKTLSDAASLTDPFEEREEGVLSVKSGGEYDLNGVEVRGFNILGESTDKFVKTVYTLNVEEIKIGLLGHLSQSLEPDIAEVFTDTDILIIPAGGKPFMAADEAAKLVRKLEPKIVVPAFFRVPDLKREAGDVKDFLKALGMEANAEEKLTLKKKELADIKIKAVVLKI